MKTEKEIYLVCGSGGVGKTTVAASLGLKYALQGKNVIVLTIDPAKRLATSLGLQVLSDKPKKIDLSKFSPQTGQLWAMMLDTKRTFDRLIEKYATTKETKNKILSNKLYQHMSNMLAGSQDYMAMERLYEIQESDLYDTIIIDTPPMQNAQDFLMAPQKMMNVINNSMLHILIKPTLRIGKSSLKFLEKSTQHILKIFDRITGFAFLQDLSEMLIAFKDLLSGFELRARQINEILQKSSTHFVLVSTTQEHSYQEAMNFTGLLQSQNFHLKSIILNRIYEGLTNKDKNISDFELSTASPFSKEELKHLMANYKKYLPLIKKDQGKISQMSKIIPGIEILAIPLFLSDIHDISSLYRFSLFLTKVDRASIRLKP